MADNRPGDEKRWWETAEDHRFALEVLQLGLRRKMLGFIASGQEMLNRAVTQDDVVREFCLRADLAAYHLALLEKALVISSSEDGYRTTSTGRAYLDNVERAQ